MMLVKGFAMFFLVSGSVHVQNYFQKGKLPL